ncbi:MAG: DUF4147 domain-containing protein [Candidatus Paceibacterota bacterium]
MNSRIQNQSALATTALRTDALAIVEAGYAALDVGTALARTLHIEGDELSVGGTAYPLAGRPAFFVGVGKCAFATARAIEKILGDKLLGGIALDVSPLQGDPLQKIETFVGTHPLPSEVNEAATRRILDFLDARTENDLVIMLISGGGSTLLCDHEAPMTCLDESSVFRELTARGALIQDINTVRKHTSRARGGALAAAAYPAEVISLIVSDVPGNDLSAIASGPTVLDTSTVDDARAILARYEIPALEHIQLLETPKDQRYFDHTTNVLFLTSHDALAAMKDVAAAHGYTVEIVNDQFAGEAREVGRTVVESLHTRGAKTALLYAGESTVTLAGESGKGGRNQEMALAVLGELSPDELVLPFASDGRDNTEYAGAIADRETLAHAQEKNLSLAEYLDAHRSYDFFTLSGDALLTGYTGSNVSDLIVALKK